MWDEKKLRIKANIWGKEAGYVMEDWRDSSERRRGFVQVKLFRLGVG